MFNESEAPFFPRFGVGFFVCLFVFVFVFVFVFCFEVAGIEMIKLNKIKKSSTFKVHECIGLWAGHSTYVLPSNSARVQKIPALATALISL